MSVVLRRVARKTSVTLASASSVVEVRDQYHKVRLGHRVILVYNMSMYVVVFQYVGLRLTQSPSKAIERPLLREVKTLERSANFFFVRNNTKIEKIMFQNKS